MQEISQNWCEQELKSQTQKKGEDLLLQNEVKWKVLWHRFEDVMGTNSCICI